MAEVPKRGATVLPAPLAAVALATAVTVVLDLPVAGYEVQGLLEAVQPPGAGDFAALASFGRTRHGAGLHAHRLGGDPCSAPPPWTGCTTVPRTDYDKELMAQGAGNTVCGALGALPMTAVIVRSSANVQAGARTKASRVLHGVWLLLFVALLPAALA